MENPYEHPPVFEKGFSFSCEGRQYKVNTGSTNTPEGTKYRVEIRPEGDESTTPLFEHSGMNEAELSETIASFQETIGSDMKIEDVIRELQNLVIDRHNDKEK